MYTYIIYILKYAFSEYLGTVIVKLLNISSRMILRRNFNLKI